MEVTGATATTVEATITGLTNNAPYLVAIRATHSSVNGAWIATTPAQVTPKPLPVITLSTDKSDYTEGVDSGVLITLRAEPIPEEEITVEVTLTENGVGRFFTVGEQTKTVTWTAGSASAEVTANITHDHTAEEDTIGDGILVALQTGTGYKVSDTNGEARITVANGDTRPGPPTNVMVFPGTNGGEIRVTWTNPTVDFEGNAFKTTRHGTIDGYRVCAALTAADAMANMNCQGDSSLFNVPRTPTAMDNLETTTIGGYTEGAELYISLAVRNDLTAGGRQSDFVLADNNPVTVTETDNTPVITLSLNNSNAGNNEYTEGTDSVITVIARADPVPAADLTVNVRMERGGVHLFLPNDAANSTITIPANMQSGTVEYIIDADVFADGTVNRISTNPADHATDAPRVRILDGDDYTYDATHANAPTFSVTDDDAQSSLPTITSVEAGDTRLVVNWTAPSDPGLRQGSTENVDNYFICVHTDIEVLRTFSGVFADCAGGANNRGGGNRTYTVTGLTNDTAYYVGLAARNGVSRRASGGTNSGGFVEYTPFAISAQVTPIAPVITLSLSDSDAGNNVFTEGTDNRIVVTATAAPLPVSNITVNVRLEGGGVGRFIEHDKTISIPANQASRTVNYDIPNDNDQQEADTNRATHATDPPTAMVQDGTGYTADNTNAPTFRDS